VLLSVRVCKNGAISNILAKILKLLAFRLDGISSSLERVDKTQDEILKALSFSFRWT
jgi:hypothetical protein